MNNKPTYNPSIHHRRSIRLKGYDYSQKGLYFVTMCVRRRLCLFGEIKDGEMILNDAGIMINKWYIELENKFNDIKCLEHVVMPNHFHCIIENTGVNVGADLRVRPDSDNPTGILENPIMDEGQTGQTGQTHRSAPTSAPTGAPAGSETSSPTNSPTDTNDSNILGEHKGSPLYSVIQWFKTMSTNEYIRNVKSNNWQRFDQKLFQRNYYEHIIRDEKSYVTIANYIINNPKKWDNDSFNPTKEKK